MKWPGKSAPGLISAHYESPEYEREFSRMPKSFVKEEPTSIVIMIIIIIANVLKHLLVKHRPK